jgi:hypothetical protein
MTLMMLLVAPMMGVHMDIAASIAMMLHVPWIAGLSVHFALGILIFPTIYGYMLRSRLPGSPIARGIIWGGILWLMLEAFGMPMMGKGFFGVNGPGMMGAVAALLAHLVYGTLLGWVAEPRQNVSLEAII